jgi:hypothetical protein
VTVTYDGSDTVTSCSYTTSRTQLSETKALPEPEGYVPLHPYGSSLTTWVVTVTQEAVGMTKCGHSFGLPDDPQDAKRP